MKKKQYGQSNIAIIFGSKSVNAAGLIRSLGIAGIETAFLSSSDSIDSRYLSHYYRLPKKANQKIYALISFVKSLNNKPVILPGVFFPLRKGKKQRKRSSKIH
jgi:hypothetical protein